MSEERDSYATDPNVIPDTASRLPRPALSGVTEPLATDVVLCSYPDTMDGFAAAWVIYQIAKRDNIPVEFVPGSTFTPEVKEIEGRNWFCVTDTTPPAASAAKDTLVFARVAAKANTPLPYKLWQRTIPFGIDHITHLGRICGVHDPKRSLCRIVWEFFCADRVGFEKPPRILAHIDDYVLGAGRYNDSHAIATAISTYPHDFKVYTALAKACDDRKRREAMVAAGQGISRYIDSLKQ